MRNNQARLGPGAQSRREHPEGPPQSGLAWTVPTEFVELPSRGAFYPEDHPLHKQETIEIKFMTAKDEDILASTTLIKKGLAIDRLLESLVVDSSINPKDLLIGDRNAIMIAARISSYGSEYKANVNCPSCYNTVEYEFDLRKTNLKETCFSEEFLKSNKVEFDSDLKTFEVLLPTSEKKISTRLLDGYDEEKTNAIEEEEKIITSALSIFTTAVEQNTDPNIVQQFIENMPASDSMHLRKLYPLLMPNIDLKQEFICERCGDRRDIEVPLTAGFFWPK